MKNVLFLILAMFVLYLLITGRWERTLQGIIG